MYVFFSLGLIGRRGITESKSKNFLKFMDTYWQIIFPNKCNNYTPAKENFKYHSKWRAAERSN